MNQIIEHCTIAAAIATVGFMCVYVDWCARYTFSSICVQAN